MKVSSEYQHKIDGFKKLFEENVVPKIFKYKNLEIIVDLKFYRDDINRVAEEYRSYWIDSFDNFMF